MPRRDDRGAEVGRSQSFPGRVVVERKESALATASNNKKSRNSLWTDRSRLDSGRVGAAVVWWEEEHTPPPWTGVRTGLPTTCVLYKSAGVDGSLVPPWPQQGGFRRRALRALPGPPSL